MAVTTRKTPIKYRRGKQIPVLRHGDLIDLTTFPLHSRPLDRRAIERCPECGRKGEVSTFRTGARSFHHMVRFETIFMMVVDACTVSGPNGEGVA